MASLRWWSSAWTLALIELLSAPARAEPSASVPPGVKPLRHRVALRAHYGRAALTGDIDGHYRSGGAYDGLWAGYAYALSSVDLGAGFDFLNALDDAPNHRRSYVVAISVRPYVGNERVEVGFGVRAGWSRMTMQNLTARIDEEPGSRNFDGFSVGFLPDVRITIARGWALDVGVELITTGGHNTRDEALWYFEQRAGMTGVGAFIGGCASF